MATDSTLQKIADNLLAQFDKTLLDNSTDFSSCDQILNAAPSEHKGGLESLYCDLLLDALISGYYRYSEMDTKQLVDDPLYSTLTEAENNEDLSRHRTSHGAERSGSTSLVWIPKLQNAQHRHPHRLGGHQVLRDILVARSLQAALLLPS